MGMTLTPAQYGLLKTLGLLVVFSVLDFLSNAANLNGVVSPLIAGIVTMLAGALESHLKANSGNTAGLFGSVRVSQP